MPPAAASFGLGQSGDNNTSSSVPIDYSTPWMAASDGNLPLLQTSLATLHLPPTAADENGYTLLHAASSYCQVDIMKFLLETHNVPVNAVDHDGDTALHHVENVEAAKVLIQHGANPSLKNSSNRTPLEGKEEELTEHMEDDEEDNEEEVETLRALVEYLSTLPITS